MSEGDQPRQTSTSFGPHRPKPRESIKAKNTSTTKLEDSEDETRNNSNVILDTTPNLKSGVVYEEESNDDETDEDVNESCNESNDSNFDINETTQEPESPQVRFKEVDSFERDDTPDSLDTNDDINLRNEKKDTNLIYIILGILVLCVGAVILVDPTNSKETFDIAEVKEKFPTQDAFLWLAFESGVHDVVTRNRPSTFILLYQKEAEDTLSSLVEQLSKYAACNITDCSKEPITITDSLLNSSEILDDYGVLIHRYRGELQEKGVMIIKNLENVPGISAEAFHSFCDEFTPLVDRSLFIFTMQISEYPGRNRMKYVEEYFRNKWTDIKIDTFNALITRISSMVLEVVP